MGTASSKHASAPRSCKPFKMNSLARDSLSHVFEHFAWLNIVANLCNHEDCLMLWNDLANMVKVNCEAIKDQGTPMWNIQGLCQFAPNIAHTSIGQRAGNRDALPTQLASEKTLSSRNEKRDPERLLKNGLPKKTLAKEPPKKNCGLLVGHLLRQTQTFNVFDSSSLLATEEAKGWQSHGDDAQFSCYRRDGMSLLLRYSLKSKL